MMTAILRPDEYQALRAALEVEEADQEGRGVNYRASTYSGWSLYHSGLYMGWTSAELDEELRAHQNAEIRAENARIKAAQAAAYDAYIDAEAAEWDAVRRARLRQAAKARRLRTA